MENDFVYSSEYACDNITRRELRSMEDIVTRVHATKFSRDLLLPIGQRLTVSGRLKRGMLKPMVERVEQTLRTEPGIIDVEVDLMTHSKLSSNEEYRFAFVAGMNDGEHWLDFMLNEARLSRKELVVKTTKSDLRIHRHAISRYMQRNRRPAKEMYAEVMEAIRAASLMGEMAGGIPGGQIALAIGDGLLLGRVHRYLWAECPAAVETLTINVKSADHEMLVRPDELESPHRYVVEMMTYVDHNSLVASREALRDRLREFQDRYAFEIKVLFEATYFNEANVPPDMIDSANERLLTMARAAKALVNGPEWQQFVATAPKQNAA